MPTTWTTFALRHIAWLPWLLLWTWVLAGLGVWAGWWRGGGAWGPALVLTVALQAMAWAWSRWQRERWIREAPMPQFLKRRLRELYPHWSGKDADLVERGLRQFFLASLRSGGKFVAMPSKAADVLWHEFILHTQAYARWCELALGRFLHHTPAEALGAQAQHNDGLRRAWFWACKEEAINPRRPTRLPLLFALDAKLDIEGGFKYLPDGKDFERKAGDEDGGGGGGDFYYGTSFSDDSASGSCADFGGADGGSSGGGDGGGGDGGSGCGSGCGGGGD